MDTRAPQMMYEKSYEDSVGDPRQGRRMVKLNVEDNLVVIELEKDRQIVRLYWTPLAGERAQEFLVHPRELRSRAARAMMAVPRS